MGILACFDIPIVRRLDWRFQANALIQVKIACLNTGLDEILAGWLLFRNGFAPCLCYPAGGFHCPLHSLGDGSLDALGLGFWALAHEEAEEGEAALVGGERVPSGTGERLAAEGGLEDGRRGRFAFHGEQEALDPLLGAAEAGLRGFGFGYVFGDVFASGVVEGFEPLLDAAVGAEEFGELGRRGCGAAFEVGFEDDFGEVADG